MHFETKIIDITIFDIESQFKYHVTKDTYHPKVKSWQRGSGQYTKKQLQQLIIQSINSSKFSHYLKDYEQLQLQF
jgi:hypothetical protein